MSRRIIVANEEDRDSSIAAKANVEIMYTNKLNLNMNSRILGHIDHYSLNRRVGMYIELLL